MKPCTETLHLGVQILVSVPPCQRTTHGSWDGFPFAIVWDYSYCLSLHSTKGFEISSSGILSLTSVLPLHYTQQRVTCYV